MDDVVTDCRDERDALPTIRDVDAVPSDWTADIVEERLKAAILVVQRTERKPGPKAFGKAWPDYQHDWMDLLAQQSRTEEEKEEDARERNRVRFNFTSAQVTAAEEALGWPARYIENENVRRALCIWMFAKAMRIGSWQKLAQRRGMNKETAKARKARAIHAIIVGLTRDGVTPKGA